ncbi:hypothetical protein HU200_055987 [Digitaria exilis]|uniref:Uncharacterized protein n=1 Tax=Digitaria exilis TaxID=1010633 RepID=A0A835AJD6_9POAL|nr:hypothetical protein HU200_055987 [Digitaria exilis]
MGEANGSAAAAAVRVLAVSRVSPAPAPATTDAGGEEGHGRLIKLSFFDTPWVVLPPIQRVFLYDLPTGDDAFPAAVRRLKDALAATLALYLPLAGKLTYVSETGDVVVDCTDVDDLGVAFVEAEASSNGSSAAMDVRRLAGDEAHDIPAFLALVPALDTRELPAHVLSVQATRLTGGLALGVSVHHAVADGQAVWRFVSAWAAAAREGSPVIENLAPPHYDRKVVQIPNGDVFARELLKRIAPNLPVSRTHAAQHTAQPVSAVNALLTEPHSIRVQANNGTEFDFSQRFRLGRRTFYLTTDDIQSLKRGINTLASAADEDAIITTTTPRTKKKKPVSTFVALAALGWTAFVNAKSLTAGDDTYLVFLADLRTRLDPPVADGYLGNCIKACLATADAGDLAVAGDDERGLVAACRAIQAAVEEMEEAPMAGSEQWLQKMMTLPYQRLCNVAASPRFRVYEASDFGFGRPARVELVSMNHDGEMVLVGGREEGEVQVSVSLDPARMEVFKKHVLAGRRSGAAGDGRS